jgi:hypothetical protein
MEPQELGKSLMIPHGLRQTQPDAVGLLAYQKIRIIDSIRQASASTLSVGAIAEPSLESRPSYKCRRRRTRSHWVTSHKTIIFNANIHQRRRPTGNDSNISKRAALKRMPPVASEYFVPKAMGWRLSYPVIRSDSVLGKTILWWLSDNTISLFKATCWTMPTCRHNVFVCIV